MATDGSNSVPMRLSPEIRAKINAMITDILDRIVWQEIGLRFGGKEIEAEGYQRQPFVPGKSVAFDLPQGAYVDEYVVYGTLDGLAVWAAASLGSQAGWGRRFAYLTADAKPFKVEGGILQ